MKIVLFSRFRRNLERCGELMAYEISKTLHYSSQEVTTPLGIATCKVISDELNYSEYANANFKESWGKVRDIIGSVI